MEDRELDYMQQFFDKDGNKWWVMSTKYGCRRMSQEDFENALVALDKFGMNTLEMWGFKYRFERAELNERNH